YGNPLLEHSLLLFEIVDLLLELRQTRFLASLALNVCEYLSILAIHQQIVDPQETDSCDKGNTEKDPLQSGLDRDGGARVFWAGSGQQIDANYWLVEPLSASPSAIARRGANSRI